MRGLIPPKYSQNFKHVSYANPNAPQGGTIKLPARKSTFSSFNPFILKGIEASGLEYLHVSLMKSPLDDQMVVYPYVAKSVIISDDFRSVTFTLRDNVKFSDGSYLTIEDVEFSYNTLKEKGKPPYNLSYENIDYVKKIDPNKIRFVFKIPDKNIAFSIAKMPIFSKKFYTKVSFDKASLIPPIGAGPYKIKSFRNGKYILYEKVCDWWAKELPIVKGLYNFNEIRFIHYYNYDAIIDGLKRGEIDHNIEMKVSRWENKYDTKSCRGIIKREFIKPIPHGLNAFFFNTRRSHLSDVRVRKALNLLFNFEWINKNLFSGKYKRSKGIFNSEEYNAKEKISDEEKKILNNLGITEINSFKGQEKKNSSKGLDRKNIEYAMKLFSDAGWSLKEGALIHNKYGQFSLEIIIPAVSMTRILENYRKTLESIGIDASLKAIDPAQFEDRLQNFDYDLVLFFMPITYIPGNHLKNMWTTMSEPIKGSYNLSGVKDDCVDQLIEKITKATNIKDIKLYSSVLDRVITNGYYFIPAWYRDEIYVAYRDKFGYINKNENGYSINAWWEKNKYRC